MLDDEGGRFVGKVLQDVGAVVHVGQIGLAGMLAGLDHLRFGERGDNALPGLTPAAAAEGDPPVNEFVERGGLIRIFAVAEAFLFASDLPLALAVNQLLVSEGNGHGFGKVFLHYGLVHCFEIGHVSSLRVLFC